MVNIDIIDAGGEAIDHVVNGPLKENPDSPNPLSSGLIVPLSIGHNLSWVFKLASPSVEIYQVFVVA